jgi:CheY-like chemotaxis protein/HPt (histidine-containing phosphotransfer) domain-containing protein
LDGQEAVLLSDKYKFDLVLMDIQMPKMDGYEATTQIRSQSGPNQNIPIIALTASALVIEKDKAKLVGMDGVLTKPFTPDQLKHTLNKYLRNDFSNNTIKSETISMETIPIDKQLNQDILIEYFGNDKDFKKMVFETFVEDIDFQIDEFKSLFMEKQWENIAKLAHKMKPSFSMVGLKHTEQLLKSIESGIKTQGINDIIINQAETFISSFPEIFNLVKTELKNI